MKIGLTGGIGCGKSTVSRFAQAMGYEVVDADKLTREVHKTAEVCDRLVAYFGSEVVAISGDERVVDRRVLGQMVFSSEENRRILNEIMQPALLSAACRRLDGAKGPVILDAALLFEAGWDKLVDKTVVILCPMAERMGRIMRRDGLDKEDVLRRISSQMSDIERVARADCLIYNVGDLDLLSMQVKHVFSLWK